MNGFDTVPSIIEGLNVWTQRTAILAFQKEGIRSWSYDELSLDIKSMARGLRWAGAGKSEYLVMLAPLRPEWVIACLASLLAGSVVVPLDAQLDDRTVSTILSDLNPKFICTTSAKAEQLKGAIEASKSRLLLLDVDGGEHSWRSLAAPDNTPLPTVESADTAALFYTSGTMGVPKGVPLSHRNITFQINALADAKLTTASDRILLPLPLHHIYPFVVGMLLPLSLGLPIIMPESLAGPQLTRAIQDGNVTIIIGVPRLYNALFSIIAEHLSATAGTKFLFRSLLCLSMLLARSCKVHVGKFLFAPVHRRFAPNLRLLACGGASLEADLVSKLEGLGWSVAIGYGLTETSPLLALNLPGKGRPGSVGSALPGVDIRIEPAVRMSQAQEQQGSMEYIYKGVGPGEILARSGGVFAGYRNLPEQTREAFTADGWFRTGDLGYFRDGALFVLGRISSLIVGESGEKIDPEQLEGYYAENPLIKEIGMLQRSGKLVAVIVPDLKQLAIHGGGDLERVVHDAVDERSSHLPRYKRLTGFVLSADPLGRTAMGKIQRHRLAERFELLKSGAQHKPNFSAQEMPAQDRRLFEHAVAQQLWRYLVDRYHGMRVNLDTSLQLDLGIDSLEWVAVTLDIRESLGVELDESAIASMSSVRDLLRKAIRLSEAGIAVSKVDALAEPEKRLSAEQKRWLEPLNRRQVILQIALYTLIKFLVQILFRPKIQGLENVPEHIPVVFTPNHASYIDAFVLAATLPYHRLHELHFAGWTGIAFSNAFTKGFSRLVQGVPIDPDRAVLSSLAMAAAVLKRRQSLVWFPEGQRTLTGELQPFKGGIGMLLERFPDLVAVPVYLKDTAKALAPGSWIIRPVKLEVIFGVPQSSSELQHRGAGNSAHERIVSALHKAVHHLDPTLNTGAISNHTSGQEADPSPATKYHD